MPTQSVNELQMHFEHLQPLDNKKRSKEPLLLLSGMASDSASWQPVVAGLQQQHELLIPDNRCTGRTRPIPVDTNRDLMVSDIMFLLDSLSIERVSIIGHSMGGMLGWALATQAPERVSHLVAASALPTIIPARIALFETLSALRKDNNESHWFELLYQFLFSADFFIHDTVVQAAVTASQNYAHKQSAEAFAQQVSGLTSFLVDLDLSRIQCPVTMITGSNDALMTPAMLLQFAADKAFINTRVIDHAAHAIHWEQTEAFLSAVFEALDTQLPMPH